jgi:hypothetical protein
MLDDDDIHALGDMKTLIELFHEDAIKRASDIAIATTTNALASLNKVISSRDGRCLDAAETEAMENARLLMVAARVQLADDSEGARAAERCILAADKVLGH